jgi:thiamine-phosphate pyrophosphorylase
MPRRTPMSLALYLVADVGVCGERGPVETAVAAVEGGATVVQLRDTVCADRDFVAVGRRLVEALAGTGVPVIVNDRVHLVAAIGAAGAHVGQDDMDLVEARRMLGDDLYLGLSVHNMQQVWAARPLGRTVLDYLGVGPLWKQTTKPNAADPCGIDGFGDIVLASPVPCVAIGGIGPGRVAPVRVAGGAGVAVVSAVCGRPDPAADARALRVEWDEARDGARVPIGIRRVSARDAEWTDEGSSWWVRRWY